MGCVTPDRRAGAQRGAGRRPRRGLAGDGGRDDRRPPVRLVDAGCVQRCRRDPGRSSRRRRRGRDRVDVARPDGLEPRRRGLRRASTRRSRERWPIVPQGISAEEIAKEWELSREDARRLLAGIESSRDRRDRRRAVRAGDRAGGTAGAAGMFAVDEAPRRDTSRGEARGSARRRSSRTAS